MTFQSVQNDIHEYGLSQWYSSKGLCTVTRSYDGTYDFQLSKGPRLADGCIRASGNMLTNEELVSMMSIFG